MGDSIISSRPPLISLFRILVVVVVFGWIILGQVLALVVATLHYPGDIIAAFSDPVNHPDLRNTLLLSQGIAALTGFVFVPWFYLKISEKKSLTIFFKDQNTWPFITILIAIAVICLSLAISPISEWNAGIQFPDWLAGFGEWARDTEDMAAAIVKSLTQDMSFGVFVFIFLVVAIIPAFGEELVFRGLIQTEMMRSVKNPHVAILITAILFSAFHLQFFGLMPRMLIGVFLGYLYYWSGNLWIPIMGHFFNNGLQLIGLYMYQKGMITIDVESTDSAPWFVVVISAGILVMLMILFKRLFEQRVLPIDDIHQEL